MANGLGLPRPGDDPWALASGWDYAAVGCGAGDLRYVLGYREAATALFRAIEARNWFSPMVMPYLYVWRHYVELHLKRLYRIAKGGVAPPSHGLISLWGSIQPLVPVPRGEEEALRQAFAGLQDVLQRLSEVDPKSTDTRYHLRCGGTRSLANAPKHMDLESFHDVMCRVASLLQRVDYLIEFRDELVAKE